MTRTVQHSSTINISTSTCTVLTGCSELAIPWPNQIVFQVLGTTGPCNDILLFRRITSNL